MKKEQRAMYFVAIEEKVTFYLLACGSIWKEKI